MLYIVKTFRKPVTQQAIAKDPTPSDYVYYLG